MGDEEPRPRRKKSKKKRAPLPEAPPPPPPIAASWAPRWLSRAALFVAILYFALIYSDTAGWERFGAILPRPLHYFGQVAALFPEADHFATEYYAEGWLCREQRWTELDVRPYFPIDADEKENRYGRALHFAMKPPKETTRAIMHALDEFIVTHENDARRASGGAGTNNLLGGIRAWRIGVPLPKFGAHIERYHRERFADLPKALKTKTGRAPARLYYTRRSTRLERCKGFYPEYDDSNLVDDLERGETAADERAAPPTDSAPADESEP